MPQVMKVIQVQDRRGAGKSEEDPVRLITQYYTLDGEFLAEERDHYQEQMDSMSAKQDCVEHGA